MAYSGCTLRRDGAVSESALPFAFVNVIKKRIAASLRVLCLLSKVVVKRKRTERTYVCALLFLWVCVPVVGTVLK